MSLSVFRHSLAWPGVQPFRLLFASDLHLWGWSGRVAAQLVESVQGIKPDALVLGGDLCDVPGGRRHLQTVLDRAECPVYAVKGNHDFWGAPLPWLTRERLPCGLTLCGSAEQPADARSLLISHNPAVFPRAVRAGFPFVVAGHLHGCQLILWEMAGMQYPGAWFFRYNGRYFREGDTTMLVSLGVHDTIPWRWNCPREVVLLEFEAAG